MALLKCGSCRLCQCDLHQCRALAASLHSPLPHFARAKLLLHVQLLTTPAPWPHPGSAWPPLSRPPARSSSGWGRHLQAALMWRHLQCRVHACCCSECALPVSRPGMLLTFAVMQSTDMSRLQACRTGTAAWCSPRWATVCSQQRASWRNAPLSKTCPMSTFCVYGRTGHDELAKAAASDCAF